MVDKANCVQLGIACADVCQALVRGIDGRPADQLSQPSLRAIEQFTTWVGFAIHALGGSLTLISRSQDRGCDPEADRQVGQKEPVLSPFQRKVR